jgi:hypothetical protein
MIGLDVSPKVRLVGGIETRKCLSDSSEAMFRLELGGGAPRVIAGVRTRPFQQSMSYSEDEPGDLFRLEAGIALDLHAKFGAHLGVTYGTPLGYFGAQLLQPLSSGDGRTARGTLLAGFSPRVGGTAVEGRPIVVDGRVLLPDVLRRGNAECAEDRAVHDHFAKAAQHEYSSVWTFLRLAAELAVVGAPAQLIAAALDAADDEVRHADACAAAAGYALLAALPAGAANPRFTAGSSRALATMAREAWLEGCLNEGAASAEAAFAAELSTGATSAMLAGIARDERSHAELAWRVLAWVSAIAPEIAEQAIASCGEQRIVAEQVDPALVRRGVPSAEARLAAWEVAQSSAKTRLRQLVG